MQIRASTTTTPKYRTPTGSPLRSRSRAATQTKRPKSIVVIMVTGVNELPVITDEDVDDGPNDCDNVP